MFVPDTITTDSLAINNQVFIRPLCTADAEAYHDLYRHPLVQRFFDASPFASDETAPAFTKRIIDVCDHVWTIRKVSSPQTIIGDCALHHWDESTGCIETGFTLHPDHWGEGIMTHTLQFIMNFAIEQLGAREMVGNTSKFNDNAARLLKRLGFVQSNTKGNNMEYRKLLK